MVLDEENFPWEIGFSRPVNRYIWIKISIQQNREESFPVNGLIQIKENIESWGAKNQDVGVDLMYQRMTIPIFQVPGIAFADIQVAVTTDVTPPFDSAYKAVNIPIGEREIARIDQSRIEIKEVTT